MLHVREINNSDDLESLRPEWARLLVETVNYSFFQTLDWLQAAWNHYAGPQKLRVLTVERDGAVIGIVPFCVRTERRKLGPTRVLTYPLDDWTTFYGPLGGEPSTTFRAALQHIAATPRDWDLIDLRYVDQQAPEFMDVDASFRDLQLDFVARPRMEVRFCRMTEGWEAYVDSHSRNWRRQMRRDINVLEKQGDVRLLRHRPAVGGTGRDDRNLEIFDICQRIAAKSWQADAESQSTLSAPRVRDLLLELHCRAAALGMLDTNILTVGGRPVAFNYNYVAAGRTYGLRAGFDPTAGMDHSGRVLLYKMLEDSFARGDSEYSFGPGRQSYKDRFANEMRYAYTFRHFSRGSLKSMLMRLREQVVRQLFTAEELTERNLVS